MKKGVYLIIYISCVSCGYGIYSPIPGKDGRDGSSCTVEQLSNGAKISCTDGSFAFIYNGSNGRDGQDGANGLNGQDGSNGRDGQDGSNGRDGSSCTVSGNQLGAIINCTDGTSEVLKNGTDAPPCEVNDLANGALIKCGQNEAIIYDGNGQNASTIGIKDYINPCGEEFSNESIFLRLTDDKILALYDGGNNQSRLVLLAPGSYTTTDRSSKKKCHFDVTDSYEITNERIL